MFKTNIRLLLLTTIFSTQFSLNISFAMNPDEDPLQKGTQYYYKPNDNECVCGKKLRKNAKKREIMVQNESGDVMLRNVCKKCDEDKEEQRENEERQRIGDQIGFQSFLQLRPYFENLPAPRVVPTPPPAIPPNVQIPMRQQTNTTT